MKTMKNLTLFLGLCAALLLVATVAQGQDKVMRVHSGGNVVYAANTSQVDSITFQDDALKYPKEIPFEDYSLTGTSCQWANLAYDNTIVVINTNEELNQYITCIDSEYSAIDFSKHTLLLAHGKAPSSIVNANCNSLLQFSEQSHEMEVEIIVGDATSISNWQVPIIINKLDEECTIELIVTIKFHEL